MKCDIIDSIRESISYIDYYVHLQNLLTFIIYSKQIKTIVISYCKSLGIEGISCDKLFQIIFYVLHKHNTRGLGDG